MKLDLPCAILLAAGLSSAPTIVAEDASVAGAAARSQYRLAQRLGADGSPEARGAFEKTVALDPEGPLADDALVDLARVSGAPDWPDELGGLDAARAAQALEPLVKVVAKYASADRAIEARYRLGLLRMAPIAGRDVASARQELIAVASMPSRDRWVVAARYALGVLDEQLGAPERAAGAFARILVERPGSDVAPRATVGLGRTMLVAGKFGDAAHWFQEAVEGGEVSSLRPEALRELALREILRDRSPGLRWSNVTSPLPIIATLRGASLIATGADGGVIVFDRKRSVLQAFDTNGTGGTPVPIADVTAIATDAFGRVFVATKDNLLRWDRAALAPVATWSGFGPPKAIAVDDAGSVWIVDRKGDRIGRWDPGSTAPAVVRESKGAGVAAIVVSGGHVIAAEEKTGRIVVVDGDGSDRVFGTATFRRPVGLAVDAAGRISVLDEKAGTVTRLSASGEVKDTLPLTASGVSRPMALAAGPDGAVRILDGSTGTVAVIP